MKSAWEKIFNPETAEETLSEQENDQAIHELAKAVSHVERLQAGPEHERILGIIGKKIRQEPGQQPGL
jgi:hypothetical protein